MAGVQARIPFKSRKKVFIDDQDIGSNENEDILNIVNMPKGRSLKRHNKSNPKGRPEEGILYLAIHNIEFK